ncbi:NAD(P)H:quinone oxidoreductase [Luteimonas sp. SJ-92]|uniref:NAD(P)H dehydrogenase (quinone) n=1 Tax=Luteimonas salinisoli TaxID=2752307 RepID=A0A853JF35_9GAMM|nr:NAD(P)H:quinone oxidoreductase [Luteimonas salinisoli]NZA27160.1 NAD(P)H:quinone oxidoreductase [Luteimonas salinisoli]
MTRVLVLYYSSYGHVAAMAQAVAEGVREAGAGADLRRVPELVPEAVRKTSGYHEDATPVASVAELGDYDAILFGTPTRFGNMAAQMKNFLDRCGALWAGDRLVGRIGSVFTSTGTQHGGQESTILSTHIVLMHLGMVVVGLPYSFKGQNRTDEITGGSPYGAATVASGEDGTDRRPSANELAGARFQGRHVATLAGALARGRQAESTEPA